MMQRSVLFVFLLHLLFISSNEATHRLLHYPEHPTQWDDSDPTSVHRPHPILPVNSNGPWNDNDDEIQLGIALSEWKEEEKHEKNILDDLPKVKPLQTLKRIGGPPSRRLPKRVAKKVPVVVTESDETKTLNNVTSTEPVSLTNTSTLDPSLPHVNSQPHLESTPLEESNNSSSNTVPLWSIAAGISSGVIASLALVLFKGKRRPPPSSQ